MARYRTIKAEFFSDGSLSECCRDARLLFVGLLPFVDDMGRRRYSAKQLKNEVFPGDTDIDAQKVGYWFQELVKAGVVELYLIGSIQYFRLPNFLRHQRITHPTHTDSPQSPTENGAPQCLCDDCKKRFVPSGEFQRTQESPRIRESSRLLQNSPESSHRETDGEKERGNERVEREKENTHSTSSNLNPQTSNQLVAPETSAENRRAQHRALEEIAMRILRLLQLKVNPSLVQTVTKSITVKARSRDCTQEAAAQQIAARAAFVAAESPPEDWNQWFADAAFEYVTEGDECLKDRYIEARPVCGGSRCEDGWEPVQVNGSSVLRRCPDCAKLWADLGV